VDENLKDYSLKKQLDSIEIQELIKKIRGEVEPNIFKSLYSLLLPPEDLDPLESFSRNLLLEARDMIESHEFEFVMLSCLNDSFSIFNKRIHHLVQELTQEKKMFIANFVTRLIHEFKDIFEEDYLISVKSNHNFRSYALIVFSLGIDI